MDDSQGKKQTPSPTKHKGRKHHVSQGVNLLCREGNSQPGHMQRHDKRRFHGKESSPLQAIRELG